MQTRAPTLHGVGAFVFLARTPPARSVSLQGLKPAPGARNAARRILTDMANFKSELLRVLDERGFVHQCTDLAGLDALAARELVTGYIGFDATARSLHVGSLIQIMLLYWLQQHDLDQAAHMQ